MGYFNNCPHSFLILHKMYLLISHRRFNIPPSVLLNLYHFHNVVLNQPRFVLKTVNFSFFTCSNTEIKFFPLNTSLTGLF
ncbi:hypothetical protein CW304_05275 [Bacillus sp. UFRGS-B20]|nr:hypothetical protein CW304_05275 [Bacillus sp. UFRGS-B20]